MPTNFFHAGRRFPAITVHHEALPPGHPLRVQVAMLREQSFEPARLLVLYFPQTANGRRSQFSRVLTQDEFDTHVTEWPLDQSDEEYVEGLSSAHASQRRRFFIMARATVDRAFAAARAARESKSKKDAAEAAAEARKILNWVQCDYCGKWRILACPLPEDDKEWNCTHLPGRSCDEPEDEEELCTSDDDSATTDDSDADSDADPMGEQGDAESAADNEQPFDLGDDGNATAEQEGIAKKRDWTFPSMIRVWYCRRVLFRQQDSSVFKYINELTTTSNTVSNIAGYFEQSCTTKPRGSRRRNEVQLLRTRRGKELERRKT